MLTPLFLVPILAGLTAQALKPFFNRDFYRTLVASGRLLPRYGGMPSAHSSFAASLVTVTGLTEGFTSASFAIGLSLYILVIDDALRMRMFLGRYGAALTRLIRKLPQADQQAFPYLESKLGHKPREVVAGSLLGISITLLTLYLL